MSMPNNWYDAYCAGTTTGTGRETAGQWWVTGLPPATAAAWARFGFTPAEAAPWIEDGISPDVAEHLRYQDVTPAEARAAEQAPTPEAQRERPRGFPLEILRPAGGLKPPAGTVGAWYGRAVAVAILHREPGSARLMRLPAHMRTVRVGPQRPPVWLQRLSHSGGGFTWTVLPEGDKLRPLDHALRHSAGGCYAAGDSRLMELVGFYGALAVHDRPDT